MIFIYKETAMDIKKIIKESLLQEENPLRGTGVEMASGESEVRAAARFTLDKIKDSFRKSGIYISDDYLESFISINLIKFHKKGFDFKFKVLDDEESDVFNGKAKYNSIKGSSLILEFISEDGRKFYIAFKGNGKDSLDRTFLTKQKTLQKLRKRTDIVLKGLQRGGIFDVKILDVTDDATPSLEGIEDVPTQKISLINVGIKTSLDDTNDDDDEYILPTTSEIKSGEKSPFLAIGKFNREGDVGNDSNIIRQLGNELNSFWGNKMKVWASDHRNQIMLQKMGSSDFVVVTPNDDRIKRLYKDINNYNGIDVTIGPKAFADKNITNGIEGTLYLKKVSK